MVLLLMATHEVLVMQRETRLVVCALATLTFSVGCTTERSLDGSYRETGYVTPGSDAFVELAEAGNLDVLSSTLRGTLGGVAVDHDAAATGFAEEGYTTIYNNVDVAQNGAVMTIVDIIGGLEHPSFVPGFRATYAADDFYGLDASAAFVNVIGCSGQTAGAWDYDSGAESVAISIDEGSAPETVLVTYTARFGGVSSNIVTGAFEAPR
jgi:hypothetical protein